MMAQLATISCASQYPLLMSARMPSCSIEIWLDGDGEGELLREVGLVWSY
jgi:hypothetical protein